MKQIVEIHIESLTLNGFASPDRYAIADAVQTELTRLLTERGLPASFQSGVSIPFMKAGAFTMGENINAPDTGNQIAGTVFDKW
ncbi:MAG: hypothetical protein NTW29_06990 [Bacteroidetes bacterium]|nr:hypothetical protein [Bacteroidota bacterium]